MNAVARRRVGRDTGRMGTGSWQRRHSSVVEEESVNIMIIMGDNRVGVASDARRQLAAGLQLADEGVQIGGDPLRAFPVRAVARRRIHHHPGPGDPGRQLVLLLPR
jgi:hypothetical protein